MSDESAVIVKNGEEIRLKSIKISHVQARHSFFVELSLAQTGMVHSPDEIDFHTHETEEKIKDFIHNKRGLWLIATNASGQVVGEVDITVKAMIRIRHNGLLTIGVLPSYQGLGLGQALMEHALAWAKQAGLLRIELSVFQSNFKAQNLYKKFGFVVEGVRKNFLRNLDGSFEDDVIMAKEVS